MGVANFVAGKPTMVKHTEAGTHLAGDVVVYGATPFVAHVDVPQFAGGPLADALSAHGGVYQMTAAGALPVGSAAFYDNAAKRITSVSAGNTHFGTVVAGPTGDLAGAGPAAAGDAVYMLHVPRGS